MRKIQDIKNITPGFDQQSFYQTIAKSIEKIDADLEPLHEVLSNAKPQNITENKILSGRLRSNQLPDTVREISNTDKYVYRVDNFCSPICIDI